MKVYNEESSPFILTEAVWTCCQALVITKGLSVQDKLPLGCTLAAPV